MWLDILDQEAHRDVTILTNQNVGVCQCNYWMTQMRNMANSFPLGLLTFIRRDCLSNYMCISTKLFLEEPALPSLSHFLPAVTCFLRFLPNLPLATTAKAARVNGEPGSRVDLPTARRSSIYTLPFLPPLVWPVGGSCSHSVSLAWSFCISTQHGGG